MPGPTVQISAGALSTDAAKLEVQLSRTFKIVNHWNAIHLLPEVDIFLQQRTPSDLVRNCLVSCSFVNWNIAKGLCSSQQTELPQFDKAILSTIHAMLSYGGLSKATGKKIWELFMKTADTAQGPPRINSDELKRLFNCKLNGPATP
jgi:hypothetical protein